MRYITLLLVTIFFSVVAQIQAQSLAANSMSVGRPWACATPAGTRTGAAYVALVNHGSTADHQIGAPTPVAETLAQAKDTTELLQIDYEPLPAVADAEGTLAPGKPVVWDDHPGNSCFDREVGRRDAAEAALAKAKHLVSLKMVNNRPIRLPVERRRAGPETAETQR